MLKTKNGGTMEPEVQQQPGLENANTTEQTALVTPPKKRSKKPLIIGLMVAIVILLGGVAFGIYQYIQQTPEMILKTAVDNNNFSNSMQISGRFDQADVNKPDFTFTLTNYENGTNEADITAQLLVSSPSVKLIEYEGRYFVQASGFRDTEDLAKQYTNLSDNKDIVEYVADFVDYAELFNNQDVFFEIPGYLFEQPVSDAASTTSSEFSLDAEILSYEEFERDGIDAIIYKVSITTETLAGLLREYGGQGGGTLADLLNRFGDENDLATAIEVEITVDRNEKQIIDITYDGRPFDDETLTFRVSTPEGNLVAPSNVTSIQEVLGYGIAWSELIRPDMQQGSTERDNERIADLKAMKLAFEIYKAKNGQYPSRYDIAVQQEAFLFVNMPYVDHQIFIDPAGRRTGLNGSQYAYVPEQANGDQSCGPLNGGPCERYFLVTTLDDGTEYQLNSD